MSFLKSLFGGGSSSKQSAAPAASSSSVGSSSSHSSNNNGAVNGSIERLETTIELLEKREEVLTKKCEQELLKAKSFMEKKNKNAALQCMKKKKMLEEQLTNIAAQKANMETMKFAIQNAAMNKEVLVAQRQAATGLKQLNKTMDAEQVEETMDGIRETMDQSKSVAEALAQPLDDGIMDEDELLADLENELAGMEMEEQPTMKVAAPAAKSDATALPAMPNVPTKPLPKPIAVRDEDEEALAALEAELNS